MEPTKEPSEFFKVFGFEPEDEDEWRDDDEDEDELLRRAMLREQEELKHEEHEDG